MKIKYYEWTKELLEQGHSYSEIAKIQGRDQHNVRKSCIRYGLTQKDDYVNSINQRAIRNLEKQVNEKGYELIDCIDGIDGIIHIKCKICGAVLERKGQAARKPYKILCENCRRLRHEEQERKHEADKKLNKWRKATSKKYEQISMKACPICGQVFLGGKTYCSDICRNQNKWKMKDGYRNLFPLEEVYKKDNGICYICGEKCDWNDYEDRDGVIVYGNKYPSRDHVVPKSKGGRNEWENIRLAHRICNSRKHTRPLG